MLRSSLATTRSPGRSSGARPPATPDEGDGGPLVEPGGQLGAGAPGAAGPGADDDVGAADGEGFDPKRA